MSIVSLEELLRELEERHDRERWYLPGMWMVWRLRHKARDVQLAIRFAYQRVFRGWDDRAVWSTDTVLAKNLGAQLVELSRIAHGYPGKGDYPVDSTNESFERWVADLKTHGEALIAYSELQYELDGDDWDALYEPAQEALRWVADNLGSLWD